MDAAQQTSPSAPETLAPITRGLRCVWRARSRAADSDLPLHARVLAARGLIGAAEAEAFLNPSLRELHPPSLIPDLDRAAARLLDAARARQPIAIYGDYDVDGITATAILYHTLRHLAPDADVRTYVPHRLEEGYGLNSEALRQLATEGIRVVVSVDCGVTAVEPARAARAAGLDLIITDHHNPPQRLEDLPDAYAVVHPRRPDSTYPFDHLSGAGVAYKLAWRLATMSCGEDRVPAPARALLIELLSFAALGSIADVVPLIGENRVFARHGLHRIKHSPIIGLRALVEASGLAGEDLNAEDVGFKMGPRLNACGRMGHAREAVELLTIADADRAATIARELSRLNDLRRQTEQQILAQAIDMAEAAGMTSPDRRAIILAHEDWHAGVVGIVCSRLVDRFHRPAILLCRKGDECHGSGRSIDGFSLHAALTDCATHLSTFGGHDMAAGLRLDHARLAAFTDAFLDIAAARLSPDQLVGALTYDCRARAADLSADAVRRLDLLAPFGRANPTLRLRLDDAAVESGPDAFGKTNKHVSWRIRQDTRLIRLIGWNWAEQDNLPRRGARIDAVITPRLNVWNGLTSVEAELHDLRILD
ncbi:MAG: single-stranded-DNA-specific exonuclease RecJ [Phycisphaerales bacterium]|nr:single-stranded-DNA-specific exonuclease RecJ [Phycisphaerales bacterium]